MPSNSPLKITLPHILAPSLTHPLKLSTMSQITITGFRSRDVRFPTSLDKTGSDAMNAAGDYSAAYCILETDTNHSGHGMVSRATDLYMANLTYLAPRHSPLDVETISSAQLSNKSRIGWWERLFHPLFQIGAKRGDTSCLIVS